MAFETPTAFEIFVAFETSGVFEAFGVSEASKFWVTVSMVCIFKPGSSSEASAWKRVRLVPLSLVSDMSQVGLARAEPCPPASPEFVCRLSVSLK